MTVTDSGLKVVPPDVKSLLQRYREIVVPAAAEVLEASISASQLRDRWRPYYFDTFHTYDLTVEQAWRSASGSRGLLEAGNPSADPKFEIPLMHFPVSVAHNNLDRLIVDERRVPSDRGACHRARGTQHRQNAAA